MDFDYREQMIYWTDVTTQGSMIRRMHLNGSDVQVRPGSPCPLPYRVQRSSPGPLPRGRSLFPGRVPFSPPTYPGDFLPLPAEPYGTLLGLRLSPSATPRGRSGRFLLLFP